MSVLLNHVWGLSPAQDRVWAQVAGLSVSVADGRLLMVLQAFVDESYKPNGIYVLGGYIASAETWAKFAKAWEALLPLGTRAKNGKFHFKMSEMSQHMNRVVAFYRVIENHDLIGVHCKIDAGELERAKARIWVPHLKIDWSFGNRPYSMTFRSLLDIFHNHRKVSGDIIPLDQKVDFIFDDQSEKSALLRSWDAYVAARSDEVRAFYGATPRFENDQDFLPLQAADFWAWWVRKWYEDGTPEKIPIADFGVWKALKPPNGVGMTVNEDQLVGFFISQLREVIEPGRPIYDLGFSPSSGS